MEKTRRDVVAAFAAAAVSPLAVNAAWAADPIRIGMSLALTGAGAAPSKVINTALEIWRDDLNAKGGLLGRSVELVIFDDQSNPANVPGIYTKLITETFAELDRMNRSSAISNRGRGTATIRSARRCGRRTHRRRICGVFCRATK